MTEEEDRRLFYLIRQELHRFRPGAPVTVEDLKTCCPELRDVSPRFFQMCLQALGARHPYGKNHSNASYWMWKPDIAETLLW